MDRRTRARELALQSLHQLDVQGQDVMGHLYRFLLENETDDMTRNLAWKWTKEAWENIAICDELISGAVIKWHISRLATVDRTILRLSVYQLKFCPEIPPKVVINEGIELAKKYGSDQSPGFVNGVLDAVLKKLKEKTENSPGAKD